MHNQLRVRKSIGRKVQGLWGSAVHKLWVIGGAGSPLSAHLFFPVKALCTKVVRFPHANRLYSPAFPRIKIPYLSLLSCRLYPSSTGPITTAAMDF